MKYRIDEKILELFPDLIIGVVIGKGLNNNTQSNNLLDIIKENTVKLNEVVGDKPLTEENNIKVWRDIYRKCGMNPNKFRPTAEAFLKRILKDSQFPNINPIVNAYLAVELLYMLPIGGYDLDQLSEEITLRISKGEELFIPIGGKEPEYTSNGEIIYADGDRVLTRNWNYRDSDLTKITEDTKNIILACEATIDNINKTDLVNTMNKMVEYLTLVCGGAYEIYYLDKETSVIEFG